MPSKSALRRSHKSLRKQHGWSGESRALFHSPADILPSVTISGGAAPLDRSEKTCILSGPRASDESAARGAYQKDDPQGLLNLNL